MLQTFITLPGRRRYLGENSLFWSEVAKSGPTYSRGESRFVTLSGSVCRGGGSGVGPLFRRVISADLVREGRIHHWATMVPSLIPTSKTVTKCLFFAHVHQYDLDLRAESGNAAHFKRINLQLKCGLHGSTGRFCRPRDTPRNAAVVPALCSRAAMQERLHKSSTMKTRAEIFSD